MTLRLILGILIISSIGCTLADHDLDQEIAGVYCAPDSEHFFKIEKRTFIVPEKGDTLLSFRFRTPPDNLEGYTDLNSEKICLLEQNFLKIIPYLTTPCDVSINEILKKYSYQFLGLVIDGQEHIYINAFIIPEVDTSSFFEDWITQPILRSQRGEQHWNAIFNLETLEFPEQAINLIDNYAILTPGPVNDLYNLCTRCIPFGIEGYYQISQDEFCMTDYNYFKLMMLRSTGCYYFGMTIDFDLDYTYQYLGVISQGRKYVYINGSIIYDDSRDGPGFFFYERLRLPCDGGFTDWGVLFDPESLTFSELEFNSPR